MTVMEAKGTRMHSYRVSILTPLPRLLDVFRPVVFEIMIQSVKAASGSPAEFANRMPRGGHR